MRNSERRRILFRVADGFEETIIVCSRGPGGSDGDVIIKAARGGGS